MPADAGIYGLQQPAPRINTPFEHLGQILQVRNQQEAAAGLREQRSAIADERRQKADAARLEAQQAAQFKALWTDPATGQPRMPTFEESAPIIGPENAAKVFKGIEEIQKLKWTTQQEAAQGLAALVDGIDGWPAADRQTPYTTVRQGLIDKGLVTAAQMPERYDASWVAQKKREAMTAAQRAERDKPKADYTLGDARISGETNQTIATAPPKPEKVTYGAPQTQMVNGRRSLVRPGSDGRIYDMNLKPVDAGAIAPEPRAEAHGPQQPYQWVIRNGEQVYTNRTQAGDQRPAGSEKASSGAQKRTLNFFNRAEQADAELEKLEGDIQKMGLAAQGRMEFAPNFLQSQTGQSYGAAQRAFTEARLRKDSGAAIPEGEFANDRKTYFAQPGDSKETLEQKRRARATLLASLAFESGQALGEFVGDADEAKAIVEKYKVRSAGGKAAPAAGGKDAEASAWLKANGAPDTPANRAAWIARNK